MTLRLEMILSYVSYGRKNITFYEKNIKLTKNDTLNNVFCNRIFPYYRLLTIFFKWCFIFLGKIFSTNLLFHILNLSKTSSKMYIKKKNVSFKKILLTISAIENFTFKIRNSKVVDNIFPNKINHYLWKSNHFKKNC